MKKYLIPLMLAGTAGTIATPAMAQSQDDDSFTGPRIEVLGGYDSLRSGSTSDTDIGDDDLFDSDGPDESVDGVAYGFALGYDYDLGNVVVGAEGEFMESTGEQDSDDMINAPFGYNIDVSRDLYIGGRIGYKVAPTTLVYAKGGYTSTRIESQFEDLVDDDGLNFDVDSDQSIDGYRLGAGIEQQFGDGIMGVGSNGYVKLEYRYSNYDDLSFDDEVFADNTVDIDLDRHQVVAGVGVRF